MAEAAVAERWNHTAALLALIANAHRSSRRRPFTPQDFHPAGRPPRTQASADLSILRAVFVDRHLPEHA